MGSDGFCSFLFYLVIVKETGTNPGLLLCAYFGEKSSDSDSECNFEGHRTASYLERPSSALLDHVDMRIGIEDLQKADQESAAASQRCEFFELSPR
jgi:hypothetical protein